MDDYSVVSVMHRARQSAWVIAWLMFGLPFSIIAQAPILEIGLPQAGTIMDGSSETWEFIAKEGEMLSFEARAIGDSLDPILTIATTEGVALLRNDDYDYPATKDALLEGFIAPDTATYTVTVSSYGATTGDFELWMLPGYSDIILRSPLNSLDDWETVTNLPDTEPDASIANNQLVLAQNGRSAATMAIGKTQEASPFYQSVDIVDVMGSGGWVISLIFAYQDNQNYHQVSLNDRGSWRAVRIQNGNEFIIRNWSTHPAIFPARTNFRLSALVNGFGIDVFYDGQYVGTATDFETIPSGATGMAVTTASISGATAAAQFTNFIITRPTETERGIVFPEQLVAEGSVATVRELERRNLIPTGGRMSVQINSGFARNTIAGVSRYPITDQVYGNFAIGATVSWQKAEGVTNGCGLSLRDNLAEDRFALAFVDSDNGYGLAWHENNAFTDNLYNDVLATSNDFYEMLVIATGDEVHYYLDGYYVGTLTESQTSGQIGEAVINFDTMTTTCNFNNIWVWLWA